MAAFRVVALLSAVLAHGIGVVLLLLGDRDGATLGFACAACVFSGIAAFDSTARSDA